METSVSMNLHSYLPLLFIFGLGVIFAATFLILSYAFGPKNPTVEKLDIYECGIEVSKGARGRFSVKFFLVAMIFLLFDVEVVFLFPWAILLREFKELGLGALIFVSMFSFLVMLGLGLVYGWRRGGLEWEK